MYKVKLQSFEGPFDLLVYLIESAEMSIYDIRISEITSQYLDYIKAMEDQNIEVAQEFMVLAALMRAHRAQEFFYVFSSYSTLSFYVDILFGYCKD